MELKPTMEYHTTLVDGSRVAYTARGPVNATYAYLGINGLMGGGDSFWPVIAGVPQDWRVVLPDLPGCGESEPMLPLRKHTIDGYVRWLSGFLDDANLGGKKVVLASVATGAPILDDIPYWFEARVTDTVARGDHTVYVAEVVGAGVRDASRPPLNLRTTGMNYGG